MVYENGKEPLRETSKDYVTCADTFVPAFTQVLVRAERDDGMSLVQYEGTYSVFQIPTALLRKRYEDHYPVHGDPLESEEFARRLEDYRRATVSQSKIGRLEELKDFIRHHYVPRTVK